MMATSGLVSRIQSCDFSKPEKIRFQYGSSVFPLSSAAPMAGTCDEPIPATILATASLPFCLSGFRSRLGFALGGGGFVGAAGAQMFGGRVLARARAIALDRAAAAEHHRRIVLLRRAGHQRGEMLKRMAVGGAELGGEIDIAAKLQHAVVVTLEDGVGLLRRKFELFQVFRLVGLEGFAVLVLHQRHAEHVDAIALAGAFGIEHESARNIVVIVSFAGHWRLSRF